MTNEFIEKYVPKKHKDAIEDVYKDMDGIWITLKAGYVSTTTETQTIHEYTIAEARKQLKTIVKEEVEIEEVTEEETIEEVTEEETVEGLALLDQFLNDWKEKARDFYVRLREEYFEESDKEHEITVGGLRKVYHFYTYERTYSDERIEEIMEELPSMDRRELRDIQRNVSRAMYKDWESNKTKKDLNIVASMYDESFLDGILDREVEHKRANFISKVEKKAGKIVDAKGLRIGVDGSINGTVVGEIKTVNVETIYAGGYNIQCLHYRILVK